MTLSLKPVGGPPGDATAEQMDAIADLADRYSFGELRVGHEQNLALPHVAKRDLPALWRALDKIGVATPNVNLVTDIIACPGLDYCSLANARSIPIAQELTRRFANHEHCRHDRPAPYQHLRLHQRLRATIMSATSVFSASRRTARNSTRSPSVVGPTRTQMGGTLIGPAVPYAEVADVDRGYRRSLSRAACTGPMNCLSIR